MHLFLAADMSDRLLADELRWTLPGLRRIAAPGPGLVVSDFAFDPPLALPPLVFARQWLPDAVGVHAESVREWAAVAFQTIVSTLPEDQPWRLHVAPHYGVRAPRRRGARARFTERRFGAPRRAAGNGEGNGRAAAGGLNRCALIQAVLDETLARKRRHLLRQRRDDAEPFATNDSLVQLILTTPATGYLSVATAPLPAIHRRWLSPFPKGEVQVATDRAAPSRAFAKLVEAELYLGRAIECGETCVDLGAAPGSWTYVALQRGARVLAVDRTPLREDLMVHPGLSFHRGDAFAFAPEGAVDWLLCDVIAASERSVELVLDWTRRRWCRHFVVSIKFAGDADLEALQRWKHALAAQCPGFHLRRLCANKNEACIFGSLAPDAEATLQG